MKREKTIDKGGGGGGEKEKGLEEEDEGEYFLELLPHVSMSRRTKATDPDDVLKCGRHLWVCSNPFCKLHVFSNVLILRAVE